MKKMRKFAGGPLEKSESIFVLRASTEEIVKAKVQYISGSGHVGLEEPVGASHVYNMYYVGRTPKEVLEGALVRSKERRIVLDKFIDVLERKLAENGF